MGFSACPICTEELKEGIVTTKCGHIFHDICVNQWLKNNRACPTCRSHSSKRDLIKLFVHSLDESFSLSQSTGKDLTEENFSKCKRLNEQLNKKLEDITAMLDTVRAESAEKDSLLESVTAARKVSQDELKSAKHTCSNLRTKIKYMVEDADKTRQLQERNRVLERDIKAMRGLKTILEGSQQDCEEVLRNTTDIHQMAQYIAGLKRDYASLQRSKTDVQQQAEDLQRKASFSRVTMQGLREELEILRRDKHQAEQDLSYAERRNDSLSKKIGAFEDKSLNNTNLLNVSKQPVRRSIEIQTPVQLKKRQKTEQSTPMLFSDDDDSFSEIRKDLEAELSRDDDLDRLAAELGVDINMAETPNRAAPSKHKPQDNLFTKVGFDGLGGTTRIKKQMPTARTVFGKTSSSSSSLSRKATLGNFFKKL